MSLGCDWDDWLFRRPFRDLFDFCERVDPAHVNRSAIESLVKAGAFDSLGGHRAQYHAVLERALQAGAAKHADRASGQRGLFEDDGDDGAAPAALPSLPEWSQRERLAGEREVLGYYLSSHPLAEHEEKLKTFCSHSTAEAAALPGRTEVVLGGMLAAIKYAHTKNPRPGQTNTKYAMFDLEDTSGIMRSILWPEDFAKYGDLVEADAILVVRGTIDKRPGSEEANLIVNELIPIGELDDRFTKGIVIRLAEPDHTERQVEQLYEILRGYPGNCGLQLVFYLADGCKLACDCDGLRLELNAQMRRRVDELLGPGNFRLIASPPRPMAKANGNGRIGYQRQAARV